MSSALADLRVGQSKLEEKVQKLDKHLYAIIVGGGIFAGGLGSPHRATCRKAVGSLMPLPSPEQFERHEIDPVTVVSRQVVVQMIEDLRTDLERDISEQETWKTRGAVKALRRLLSLPAQLKEQAEQEQKEAQRLHARANSHR